MTYGTHRSDNSFFEKRYVLVLSEQIIAHNFVVLQSWIELRSGSSTRVANQASLERGLYLRYTDNTCLEHSRYDNKSTVPISITGKLYLSFI